MSRVETCVSTGDDPILDNDLDDTLNDCDGDFEAETPLIKKKSRKVYEFYKTYDSLEIACFVEAIIENGCLVQIFRIFFSTKRLLSFTKYVS